MRPSKYGAIRTTVNGWTFASKAEAKRYSELLLLGKAGQIRNLELQPRFELHAASVVPYAPLVKIGCYVSDFRFDEKQPDGTWVDVVEDVKGKRLPMYAWKVKHLKAEHGIVVREVR